MTKRAIPLVALQLIFAGVASANNYSDEQKFIIYPPKTMQTCGVEAVTSVAKINREFEYTVKASDLKIIPFVDITEWDTGNGKYNPDQTILQGIGYRFMDYGIPVSWGRSLVPERTMYFSLNNRKGKSTKAAYDTQLTMEVTCLLDESDAYTEVIGRLKGQQTNVFLIPHNQNTSYIKGKAVPPPETTRRKIKL